MRNVQTESGADRETLSVGRKPLGRPPKERVGRSPKGWVLPYNLPASCRFGMTRDDIDTYMSEAQAAHFYEWMEYQTIAQCDGRIYDHDASTYRDSGCGTAHGAVYYRHDVARFLNGQAVID